MRPAAGGCDDEVSRNCSAETDGVSKAGGFACDSGLSVRASVFRALERQAAHVRTDRESTCLISAGVDPGLGFNARNSNVS